MTKRNKVCGLWKLMLAMVLGVFISAFSFGAFTAQAAGDPVVVEEEAAPSGESADNSGGAVIILMGGLLIIILAVVISVVATFVSTAAIADEL